MLNHFPYDILLHCFTFMMSQDVCAVCNTLNYRVQQSWMFNSFKNKIECHSFKKKSRCAQCTAQCLTEIVYEDNQRIEWIPYCAIHIDQYLLHHVSVYCVGGLDIHGNSLIY